MLFHHRSALPFAVAAAASLAASMLVCSSCSKVGSRLASLSLEDKAAQVLLVGVEGSGAPSSSSLELIEEMPLGGVLLFGYNLPAKAIDTARFTAALQDAAARGAAARVTESSAGDRAGDSPALPLIVAIDHEGGSVFRFKGEDISRVPAAEAVGEKGPRYAKELGRAAGSELRALGITMNLAPVVEQLSDGNAAFLGSRAYGSSGAVVDAAAGAYIEGLQGESVAAVAKHFPGNAAADPHKTLPSLDVSRKDYERDYLPRFASAIRRGASAVMLSHVVFEAIDPERPSSLSPAIVRGELRTRLGFRGLAITDDLGMKALSSRLGPEAAAVEALNAGADLLMLADSGDARRVRAAIVAAVKDGRLERGRLDEAATRVLQLKERFKMDDELDPKIREARIAAYPALVAEDAARLKAAERGL